MPIFMKLEGVDEASPSAGGASGGVWKTTNFLTADPAGAVNVSRISLSNSPSGAVDSREANVVGKAATMFEGQKSTVALRRVLFCVPKSNASQAFQTIQRLRLAATGGGNISVIQLLIVEGGNPKKLEIEFKGVKIFNFAEDGGSVSFTVEPTTTAGLLLPAIQSMKTPMYR